MNNQLSLFESEEMITTKELAKQLNTSSKVILENARKCLPNKKIENGKATLWSKAEVTVLIDCLKNNLSNHASDLYFESKGAISTDLTPALKIRNAMLMMQEAYEEELKNINAKYLAEKAINDRISNGKGCFTMNQTAKALKLPYGDKTLYRKLREMGILNGDNTPRQEHINAEHFKTVVKFVNDYVGTKSVTLTTGKGLVYLAKKFNTEIDESVKADA